MFCPATARAWSPEHRPYNDDVEGMTMSDELRPCHDCGVNPGELHQLGCDAERCCLCGQQLIGCNCVYDLNGIDIIDMEVTHPDVWNNGATDEMWAVHDAAVAKAGGRVPWSGTWDLEN